MAFLVKIVLMLVFTMIKKYNLHTPEGELLIVVL